MTEVSKSTVGSMCEVGRGWLVSVAGVKPALQVALAVIAVTLGGQFRVMLPGTEVPMTLQSLAVLLIGLTLPRRRATTALSMYLACGAVGLPVFAVGSAGLFGSTGGFLFGYVVTVWLIAAVRGVGQPRFGRLILAGGAGFFVLFSMGTLWRLPWYQWNVMQSLATGVWPFLPKALVQIVLAASLVCNVQRFRAGKKTRS